MGGGLGKKGAMVCVCVCVEADPDGATDVLAAAALLCRQTEALSRVSALCSHHLPSALPSLSLSLSSSKGFSFALSRSSEVTPAQTISLARCVSGERGGAAKEDGAGRYGFRTSRCSADSPSSRVLEAEKPPPSSCHSLDQLAACSVACRSGSPAHCAPAPSELFL